MVEGEKFLVFVLLLIVLHFDRVVNGKSNEGFDLCYKNSNNSQKAYIMTKYAQNMSI